MRRAEIIPAILPQDYAELEEKAGLIKGFARTVQVDICDGQFTPHPTWPLRKTDDTFMKILSQESGLPFWQELDYEFDLMINYKGADDIQKWITAGASRLVIHAESNGDLNEMMAVAESVEIGLALNIDTPIENIERFKDKVKFIQCMGIAQIGFQGEAFDRRSIEKIKEVQKRYPEMSISVDGGVSLENIGELIQAGATRLIVGSAIFESDNPIDVIKRFKSEAAK